MASLVMSHIMLHMETYTPTMKKPVSRIRLAANDALASKLPVPKPFGTFGEDKAASDSYYSRIWAIFISSTNEEKAAAEFLIRAVMPHLKKKDAMLDIGVGDRRLSRMVGRSFEHFTGVELNSELAARFKGQSASGFMTPTGKDNFAIIRGDFMAEKLPVGIDFTLASHVLYYIPAEQWLDAAERLVRTINRDGIVAIVLGGDEGDKASLIRHFNGRLPPIGDLALRCNQRFGDENVRVISVESSILAAGQTAMKHIAGFLLRDGETTASEPDLTSFIDAHFKQTDGTYKMNTVQKVILLGSGQALRNGTMPELQTLRWNGRP
jgi:hypothetical protein